MKSFFSSRRKPARRGAGNADQSEKMVDALCADPAEKSSALPQNTATASTIFTTQAKVHEDNGSSAQSPGNISHTLPLPPQARLALTDAITSSKPSHVGSRARKRKQLGTQPSRRKLTMSSSVGFTPKDTLTRKKKRAKSQFASTMVQRSDAGKRIVRSTATADVLIPADASEGANLQTLMPPVYQPAKTGVASVAELYGFDVPSRVKKMYSIIRAATGALGGAAAGGAIYGEVTMTSFHRLVYYLESLEGPCQLNVSSSFLDVGAGLGKPNLHVASHTGCVSVGVEMIGTRWWRSLAVLRSVIARCPDTPPPLFIHADVLDCALSSFTHIYSFDRGFPPQTLSTIFQRFQSSSSARVLVCYQQPKRAKSLGLTVPAVQRFKMKMAGSGEQHSCWVYMKQSRPIRVKDGLSLLRAWPLPRIPDGSTVLDSPVSHVDSYQFATSIAALAIEDMSKPTSTKSERSHLQEYYSWVVDQQGLARCCRSKRRTRPKIIT